MVEKRFGAGPLILDRVSFSAACGDFIALIGPSGCGKSTILKLIAGLIPRTSGRIIIDGMEPEHAGEELAYVFQEPTLMPWLTVQRNVEMPMRLRGWGFAESRSASSRRPLRFCCWRAVARNLTFRRRLPAQPGSRACAFKRTGMRSLNTAGSIRRSRKDFTVRRDSMWKFLSAVPDQPCRRK
jgi:ABC-type sugar transport system ATPase subunit